MLLIIELVLVFFAFRQGWRWWSLLPFGIAFGFSILLGLAGMTPEQARVLGIGLDVGAISALAAMLILGRKKNAES